MWPIVRFDEIVRTSQNGFSARHGEGQPAVVLRLADVDSEAWSIASSDLRQIGMSADGLAKYGLNHGDLLVVRVNGSPAIAGRVVPYFGPAGFAYCDHFIRFQLADRADPRFIAYQFRHRPVRSQVERGMVSTAGQHTVSQRTFAAVTLELPPLDEQRRIVAAIETHFSRLDAAVASLTRAKANVKRARASVLKAAVEGRLVLTEAALARAEGRDYEPASVLLDRILAEREAKRATHGARGRCRVPLNPVANESQSLPEGWCWATAEQVSDGVESGTTPAKEHFVDQPGVPFIKVYHLTFNRRLDFFQNGPTFIDGDHHRSRMQRSTTRPGDVLTNIVGPPLGKVSVVPDQFLEWNVNQAIARFRPLPGILRDYLASYLESTVAQVWLAGTAKTTTSQVNLAITTCRRLPVPLPPQAEQLRIVAEVDRRLSVLDSFDATLDANLARCARLRQSILKRAFEGRLVPAESPEPPAVATPHLAATLPSPEASEAAR